MGGKTRQRRATSGPCLGSTSKTTTDLSKKKKKKKGGTKGGRDARRGVEENLPQIGKKKLK